jgi:limonene-1,2-epoxide hydrolase
MQASKEKSPLVIVEALAAAINRHDVGGIMRMLHAKHVFTDSRGNSVRGAKFLRKAWENYFAMIPDYWVRIDHGVLAPEYIALFGEAGGTLAVNGNLKRENRWHTPAAWRAVVVDDRVKQWQIYADNEPIRLLMRKQKKHKKRKKR